MIGIFGGTFDPIHYGHLRSALEVSEIFNLSEVRLIPSAQPPHRHQPNTPAALRLHMVRLAIADQANFIADDREIRRDGFSYTVDTLQSLRQEFPQQPLLLFIGTDAFNKLDTWHRWRDLFLYAHVVVLTRPGFAVQIPDDFFKVRLTTNPQTLANNTAGSLYFQSITQLDISATQLRQLIGQGKNPRFLLPEAVIATIQEHQLYLN